MVVAVLGHRRLQIGDPGLDRLIEGEVEEPRQFPPRLVRPRWATRPENARGPEREPERGDTSPVRGQPSSGVVTATYSIVWPGWVGAMNWFLTTRRRRRRASGGW